MSREQVYKEIDREYNAKNDQWGELTHDIARLNSQWLFLISMQIRDSYKDGSCAAKRTRFIQIAALAVAAIESLDRQNATAESGQSIVTVEQVPPCPTLRFHAIIYNTESHFIVYAGKSFIGVLVVYLYNECWRYKVEYEAGKRCVVIKDDFLKTKEEAIQKGKDWMAKQWANTWQDYYTQPSEETTP